MAASDLTLHRVGDAEWDRIVGGLPEVTPYHSAGFLRANAEGLGRDLRLVAADVDGSVVGGVPLLVRRRGPVASVNWDPVLPRVGPLVPPQWQSEVLRQTRRFVGRYPLFERYESTSDSGDEAGEYEVERLESYVLDLTAGSEADLLKAMNRNARRNISRAGELTVDDARPDELAEALPRWSDEALRRTSAEGVHRPDFVAAAVRAMQGSCDVWAGVLRQDDQPLTIWVVLALGTTAVQWQLAADPERRELSSGYAAYWHSMCWARRRGCTTLDLGLAPTDGIVMVKRGLGAVPRPVFRYSRQARPARVLNQTHAALSSVRARLRPGSVAEGGHS